MLGGQFLTSAESQCGVSSKMDQAMHDLALKAQRQRRQREREEVEDAEKDRIEAANAAEEVRFREIQALHDTVEPRKQLNKEEDVELDVNLDSTEIEHLRELRRKKLQNEARELQGNLALGHGELTEIVQDEFLSTVLKSRFCVVHFFHRSFEKCKIMNKLLSELSREHPETRFCNINAEKAPFFVGKLGIRVLPSVVCFIDGKKVDNVVGFQFDESNESNNPIDDVDNIENEEDYKKMKKALEARLGLCGVVKMDRSFYFTATQKKGQQTSETRSNRKSSESDSDDDDW